MSFGVSDLDPTKLYYLASPYTHANKDLMQERYDRVNHFAAKLIIKRGINVIEPICTGHVKVKFNMPVTFEYWKERDHMYIRHSDAVIVYMLDGWKESRGVQEEIKYAQSLNKPIYYLKDEDLLEYHELHADQFLKDFAA
jgi:hypothetical protein